MTGIFREKMADNFQNKTGGSKLRKILKINCFGPGYLDFRGSQKCVRQIYILETVTNTSLTSPEMARNAKIREGVALSRSGLWRPNEVLCEC